MGAAKQIAVGAVFSAFSGQLKHNQLILLDFVLDGGPPTILFPNRLIAFEKVLRRFCVSVEVLSDSHASR